MNAELSRAVADRLFAAIEAGDQDAVARMWSPGIAVWHTGDEADLDRDRALKVIRWFIRSTTARSYEILDRRYFDGGFVQQHVLRASGADGASIAMRVCIVISIDADGSIVRIDEYFDPADLTPLLT